MINAFHSNWTKPFLKKNKQKEYYEEDFSILVMILSALKWRQNCGKIKMITDKEGADFYTKRNMTSLWDLGIQIILDDEVSSLINPEIFWAAGKIYSLKNVKTPCVMLDTDMIVWNNIEDLIKNSKLSVIHLEELNPSVYPDKEYFKDNMFINKHNELDWSVLPCNTAFMYIDNKKLKDYYIESSIEFMKASCTLKSDHITNMVFAEQRLLSMCAKEYNISINALYDINDLFSNNQCDFTHIWGEKRKLFKDSNYREVFCIKCIDRILNDFPQYEFMIKSIPEVSEYYKKYCTLCRS